MNPKNPEHQDNTTKTEQTKITRTTRTTRITRTTIIGTEVIKDLTARSKKVVILLMGKNASIDLKEDG